MRDWSLRTSLPWLALFGLISATAVIRFDPGSGRPGNARPPATEALLTFKTMLFGIVLEALPFLLLGVAVSAFMQAFVSDRTLRRLIPNHPLGGIAAAAVLCLLFPLCECGIVPIVRRLIAKGMPAYIGVVFLLAGPIFNPVVFAATRAAFRTEPQMAYWRLGFGLLVGCLIALIVYLIKMDRPLKFTREGLSGQAESAEPEAEPPLSLSERIAQAVSHAGHEFFEMGKYLLIGATLTAVIQSAVPRSVMAGIGQSPLTATLLMMGLAFALSLCSTSDAFVASAFAGMLPSGSLLAFLVLGPMLDTKSLLMMLSAFRGKFVLLLILLVVLLVLLGALVIERLGLVGSGG
ncbi:permease [Gorillibacterium sp. sgz500922]|uniref:permease n=1 Tax=Gorillibacterium sp. sgz500922 TaxID=3446694 RepID=UPI003F6646C9